MSLLNLEKALVSQDKVTGYLLNPLHPDGAAKACFFGGLGFSAEQWHLLANALLRSAETGLVAKHVESAHEQKYIVDGRLETPRGRSVVVRTVWIVDHDADAPRLVTAYPREAEGA